MIHPLAEVQTSSIGPDTKIWQFVVILKGAIIGNNCNINCHTFIENDVIIGNNVTVKSGVFIWDGIRIEDNVFIGPNVTFINDKIPRSKKYTTEYVGCIVKKGASLGASATLFNNITIGEYAMVGAGAVVTKNVKPYAMVYGNPARQFGWVDENGIRLIQKENGNWWSPSGEKFKETSTGIIKL